MLFDLIICEADDKGAKCPKCGRTDTDKQGDIWYCYNCGHEW